MPKVEKNEDTMKKCLCPACPSHNDCAKEKKENVFCAGEVGKSVCITEKKGCICGGCAVHSEHNLTAMYYCINGSADEIEGA